MPFTLTMPKLSPTMEEGSIAKWHKKVGDFIEVGDVIMEVATDKAVVEHSAIDSGWVRQILIPEGKEAIVNQALAILTEKQEESIEGYQPEGVQAAPKPSAPAATPEASTPESPAPIESSPQPPISKEKGLVQPAFVPEPPLEKYEFYRPTDQVEGRIKASPLAKKLAKEKNIDISTVKGTGPNQRIMSRDLDRAQPAGKVVFGRQEIPEIIPGTYEEETLTPMRKAIAQRLQEAKTFIPHFYVSHTIDAAPLVEIREQLRQFDVKITYNDFIIKACALALREHPKVNSGFDSVKNKIIQFKTIDISVAVSIESGLITPIIRHADFKNLGAISVEVKALSKRAKELKLAPEEYKGGSFTVSNLGMYGIDHFQAIISPPQAAILAVGGVLDVPVVKNGAVVPGKTMTLTLSCDHRVVDGVAGAEFLKTLQKYLENPAVLLI
jgi:pyruvate dehydrogenase E2 component (dihydrolipoamide acetyltransferase)